MKIEVNNLTQEKIGLQFLSRIARKTAKLVKLNLDNLSIAVVDGRKMRELNN